MTGNAADGRAYFNGTGGCPGAIPNRDSRYRTRYSSIPTHALPQWRPAPAPPKGIFTLASGHNHRSVTAEDGFGHGDGSVGNPRLKVQEGKIEN
jgi:hypothetical protein